MIATATPRDSTADPSDDRGDFTVLYDADCGFCRTALALVLRADTRHRLRPLALGSAEADRLLHDLSVEQREASWHLVDPAGHRTSAGAAAPALLRLLPGGTVPAALLAAVPQTTERAYAFVAGHRSTLSRLIPEAAKRRATALIARRSEPA
jgi:predicted DCC family thiol-disulfide oxidoreductase YuxK